MMQTYTKKIGLTIAFLLGMFPAMASARPVVSVGLNFGPPVVVVRPPMPGLGYVWMDGSWGVNAYGVQVWNPGYWAAPRPVVVRRSVVVHRPVVVGRPVVVRRPVVVHRAAAPRTVVVRRGTPAPARTVVTRPAPPRR